MTGCGVLKMTSAVTGYAGIQTGIVRVWETSAMMVSAMRAPTAA